MLNRRDFLKLSTAGAAVLCGATRGKTWLRALAGVLGQSLDPVSITKYATSLFIPPAMPRAGTVKQRGAPIDIYEVSARQLDAQVLPEGFPKTTVMGYGPLASGSRNGTLLHHAPGLTFETSFNRPVRVKWANEFVDANGNYQPHFLPVDSTLHWANPPGGLDGRDMRSKFSETPEAYTGPVPTVTHLHGALNVGDESDGYPAAWYLPTAGDIPDGYATVGTWYDYFKSKALREFSEGWAPGSATFQYPNENRASALWYHDHALGMTRVNIYAGLAGQYILRGGPSGDKAVIDTRSGTMAVLPGPAPKDGDQFPSNKAYYEIPLIIQDRSFNADGSLFYPDSREFFDGYTGPYIPDTDVPPIWNPEFFGNAMTVNGNTWPYLNVEQRRYRFRLLNGCDSRFLVLKFDHPAVDVWQIGNDGGFLSAPVHINDLDVGGLGGVLLLTISERADIIVDFSNVPVGTQVTLLNLGPDEPFGGFPIAMPSDPNTTGQVMQFRVGAASSIDNSTPPQYLQLPALAPLPTENSTRRLTLMENAQTIVQLNFDGPVSAMLGVLDSEGMPEAKMWMDPVTENPAAGSTEVWELHNFTEDAHPIHVHAILFEVVNRQALATDEEGETTRPAELVGDPRPPEPWETGRKDVVIAYPGEVTRIRATFKRPGTFVWHCHITSHEDNEMMRPYRIGPADPAAPG